MRLLFLPLSWMYSALLWLRNRLYDLGILPSFAGAIPTIVIGNLSLGGTGKTPHTLYLLNLLSSKFKMGVLSRGYGRNTRGFLIVDRHGDASMFGDEPLLISKNHPTVPLAVCEDRLQGLLEMKRIMPFLNWVVLDDAFQHRKLKGTINLLLTRYDQPYCNDFVLPSGDLRDHPAEKKRAHAVIVTKCPNVPDQLEIISWRKRLKLTDKQHLFFSALTYKSAKKAFERVEMDLKGKKLVAFSGIANPKGFENYLGQTYDLKKFKSFSDHYQFTLNDLKTLHADMLNFGGPDGVLVTTEKDLSRIIGQEQLELVKSWPLFVIPVEVVMIAQEENFNDWLIETMNAANGEHIR